jgi:DUF917 family protein
MRWQISEGDLGPIALGAAVLGTGGGGNPYLGMLRMRELLRAGRRVEVVDPDELPDDAFVATAGGMGVPVVSSEKLPQGEEEAEAVRALEEHLGRRVDAIAPLEMGGSNSLVASPALLDTESRPYKVPHWKIETPSQKWWLRPSPAPRRSTEPSVPSSGSASPGRAG